jgi:hypothetical protein
MCKTVMVFWRERFAVCLTDCMKPLHLSIDYKGKHIEGEARPLNGHKVQGVPLEHKLIIDGKDYGTISCTKEQWSADMIKDQELVKTIGSYIHAWYE